MSEIIKVQRPLNNPSAPWLIYARGRNRLQTLPPGAIPPYVIKAMGDDVEGYFTGHWSSIVGWAIAGRVEDQPW